MCGLNPVLFFLIITLIYFGIVYIKLSERIYCIHCHEFSIGNITCSKCGAWREE